MQVAHHAPHQPDQQARGQGGNGPASVLLSSCRDLSTRTGECGGLTGLHATENASAAPCRRGHAKDRSAFIVHKGQKLKQAAYSAWTLHAALSIHRHCRKQITSGRVSNEVLLRQAPSTNGTDPLEHWRERDISLPPTVVPTSQLALGNSEVTVDANDREMLQLQTYSLSDHWQCSRSPLLGRKPNVLDAPHKAAHQVCA